MKIKRMLSLLVATAMTVTAVTGAMSVSAISADDGEFDSKAYYTSGRCGENASWLINSDGVLVISGTGVMSKSYTNPSNGSKGWGWSISGKDVNEIVIEDGITSPGTDNISIFNKDVFPNLSKVTLPPSLTEFHGCFDGSTYAYPFLKDIYVYSKIITDASTIYNNSYATTGYAWPGSGIIWHVYKGSDTEKSLREDLKLTDEDINYIADDEQMPTVTNKTPAELEPLTDTSGPAGVGSKWEWNSTSKTLTFSGKAGITIADGYKKYAETTEHIIIKSGITGIVTAPRTNTTTIFGDGAFYGFTALKDVELPETLKTIGSFSFYQTPITKIDLPSTLEYIGFRAFRESNLEQISFSENLNTIEESAFSLSKIKSINLHEGMTIGGSAFQGCESLKEVTVPKNIYFLRTAAGGAQLAREHCTFADCTGLEKIVIEDGCVVEDSWGKVQYENAIVENFCQNCTSLKKVIIKGGIDCIMPRAFGDCPLNDIYFYNTELSTVTAKGTDTGTVYMDSFDTTNNPSFHVVKDSTTEQTLKDAGYLTADNTVYMADTTALETAIAEAEAIETDKYTDETVSALTKAIENAKATLENYDATQDEVDNAVKAINEAKNALTDKSDEPSNPSDSSSDPSDSSNNPSDSSNPSGSGQSEPSNSGSSQPTSAQPATNAPTTASPKVTPPTATTVTKPAKVKSVKLKAKKKKLNVSWKKVSGATGYEVKAATNSKFTKGKKTVTVKKNKVTIKNLKPKKKYYVKVRAYKLSNGRKFFGKWSKVVKKKVR